MKRCLELALNGLGYVAPNPLVGCVIVYQNKIIAEAYHKQYGGPHAEVNAISSVKDKSLLSQSTLYVNLEPCSHYGKTPPCANLIIESKIPKVVVCNTDPFELVLGKGIQLLRKHNIEVITGVLEDEGWALNKRFLTWVEKKRPYIILKWAQSADGFIWSDKQSKISNDYFDILNHTWRTQESAILIGKNTALTDNPYLTSRLVYGPNPKRIVIDFDLELPNTLHLFNTDAETIILNNKKEESQKNITFKKINDKSITTILNALYELKIQSVIVEGGRQLLNSFIKDGLWDEIRKLESNVILNSGVEAPYFTASPVVEKNLEDNKLLIYLNNDKYTA